MTGPLIPIFISLNQNKFSIHLIEIRGNHVLTIHMKQCGIDSPPGKTLLARSNHWHCIKHACVVTSELQRDIMVLA